MKKLAFTIILLLTLACPSYAYDVIQAESDLEQSAGMRIGVYVYHNPIEELELILSEDIRLRDNFGKMDMFLTTAELAYKVNEYFKFGAAYSMIAYYKDGSSYSNYENYWEIRNRIYLHASGAISAGRFKFSLREQIRCTFRGNDYYDSRTAVNPIVDMRSRLTIQYAIQDAPLTPYVAVEMFNPLHNAEYDHGDWISNLQYKAGIVWKINKSHSIDFFYLLDQTLGNSVKINDAANSITLTPRNSLQHIIAIYYRYRF